MGPKRQPAAGGQMSEIFDTRARDCEYACSDDPALMRASSATARAPLLHSAAPPAARASRPRNDSMPNPEIIVFTWYAPGFVGSTSPRSASDRSGAENQSARLDAAPAGATTAAAPIAGSLSGDSERRRNCGSQGSSSMRFKASSSFSCAAGHSRARLPLSNASTNVLIKSSYSSSDSMAVDARGGSRGLAARSAALRSRGSTMAATILAASSVETTGARRTAWGASPRARRAASKTKAMG
mmetsp:Transcript_33239/g.114361  ORF Transcript_33239/g.114361 Transcript_33239/m.114361 type:complete len:241 (-) Transcript_33239:649-1371(-)